MAKRKKRKSGLLNTLKEYSADTSKSLGSGILKGGASLVDLPVSVLSYPFREKDPNRHWAMDALFGYQPVSNEIEGSVFDYAPQTTVGRYAQSLGEFIPGGFIGKAPKVVKAAVTLAGGLGSEAAGDVAGHFLGEQAKPYAKMAGGLLLPFGATRLTNRKVGIPNTVIPKELPPGGEEALVALAGKGNKLFEKPLMQWAEGGVGDFLSKTRGELEELSNLNKGSHAEKTKLFADKQANNLDLVERLKDEIRQYEPNLSAPKSQKLPSTNFIEDVIMQVGDRNLFGLDKLRREMDFGRPGARETYRIIKNFIEDYAPGYQEIVHKDNVARQAEVMLNSLKSKSIRSKDNSTALKNFANDIKHKLETQNKNGLDFETLNKTPSSDSQKLTSLYDEIQGFKEAAGPKSPEAIKKAIAERSLSNEGSIGHVIGHPLKSTGKGLEYILRPNAQQRKFMELFPENFGSPYGQGLKGAGTSFINSSLTSPPIPITAEDFFVYQPPVADEQGDHERSSIVDEIRAARGNMSQGGSSIAAEIRAARGNMSQGGSSIAEEIRSRRSNTRR